MTTNIDTCLFLLNIELLSVFYYPKLKLIDWYDIYWNKTCLLLDKRYRKNLCIKAWLKNKTFKRSRGCLVTFFENSFLFSRTKKIGKHVWQPESVLFYVFCPQKYKIRYFRRTSFSCFQLFFKSYFKNNYISIYND